MATYSAQNIGACELDRVRLGVEQSTILTLGLHVISALIVIFFRIQFTKLLIQKESIDALA